MTAPAFRFRKVVLEVLEGGDVLAMDEDGNVDGYASPEAAVRALKARDAKAARRGESTATLLEWTGELDGFTPPEVGA